MELRKTEETIDELSALYESIRQSNVLTADQASLLPPLPPKPSPNASAKETGELNSDTPAMKDAASTSTATENGGALNIQLTPIADLECLVQTLARIENSLVNDLQPGMVKFRKRLTELDPVTEKPRYGPKSQARVERVLQLYDFLCWQHLTANNKQTSKESGTDEPSPSSLMFRELHQRYQEQLQETKREQALEEQAERLRRQKLQRQQQEQEARHQALKEQQAAKRAAEEEAAAERLAQQAEAARQMRRAQEEARRQAERDWLDAIPKGPDGVRHYLEVLKEATATDPAAHTKAVQSLCTIFEQIHRHPEEVNFRKIRKNHPRFHQDIGRHNGGIELLVAAGFRPTMLSAAAADPTSGNSSDGNDESPTIACLISKEPNLEQDMDGWTAWYDLNKATLEILQKEIQKIKR
mmetsp:Transcript_27452/g.51510  ORF Transcript_27452/g.51510 Transcript_27452/m.51510 type:complete len:412 (-) Transcript_27452:114-1349(-)